ncbi:MAG: hypothetical protein WEB63_03955 [Cucumibacter sp.]
MLGEAVFHDDGHLHDLIAGRHANAVLNQVEFERGAEVLRSAPPMLRITISRTCNIANEVACAYCSWDWAKRMETDSPDQTPDFLMRLGRFFDDALAINDCSYGEPPLEKQFGRTVEMATEGGRVFEFTSNGQTLSAKNRAKLVGRPARVYVSVDAATSAGYKRYRDHRFDLIVENLTALAAEKGGRGVLPELIVSFIIMASNVAEIEPFVELMASVGVDRLCFRSLYLEDRMDVRRINHYGYKFDYDRECLNFAQLREIGPRCREAARRAGVDVTVEWDDFAVNNMPNAAGEPLCGEPWKTAYLLNRGLMPCCYGRDPIVKWSEINTENLASGIEAALNSTPMRDLRRDLASGRLGRYCEATTGCPIVRSLAAKGAQRATVGVELEPAE